MFRENSQTAQRSRYKHAYPLKRLFLNGNLLVPTMAQGILMLKEQISEDAVSNCPFLQVRLRA